MVVFVVVVLLVLVVIFGGGYVFCGFSSMSLLLIGFSNN